MLNENLKAAAEQAVQTTETVQPIEIDGTLYDPETGEQLDDNGVSTGKKPFSITDKDSLAYCLRKLRESEATIIVTNSARQVRVKELESLIEGIPDVQAIRLQILAIDESCDMITKPAERKKSFFNALIEGEGVPLVKTWLEGVKERTWHCLDGSIGFRKTSGTLKVKSSEKAVDIASVVCPEAIVESVSVTAVKKALFEYILRCDGCTLTNIAEAFDYELPTDKATIKTGV
jgi:hypothetical protein